MSFSAFSAVENSAEWVVEAGVMVVSGAGANDLYDSLNAKYILDPMSTNYEQQRVKENAFAKCVVNYHRFETNAGESEWERGEYARCTISAPEGTVNKF